MNMKQFLLLTGVSLTSAVLSVGLYRQLAPPTTVIVEQGPGARFTDWSDDPVGELFPEDGTTGAPANFSYPAVKVTPAVVNIRAVRSADYRFFNFDAPTSTGSGVIISGNGYIVTNHHVIDGGETIEVTLHDKREYKATVVGVDPSTDLALLRIAAEDLAYVRFANSDSLQVGEWVVAVGNPFNLESTVTAGIVSAKGRSINILSDQYRIESFIQTDAAINPGNSGGALVNTRGGLVGINSAIVTRSGKYEGYSFAIPSNLVLKVVRDLREFGTVQRGILGINVDELTHQNALDAGLKPGEGVLITQVNPSGAAFDAGLRSGDVVWSINQTRVRSVPQLQEQIARYRPGQKLQVLYFRNGNPVEAEVVLKEIVRELAGAPGNDEVLATTGLEIRELSMQELRKFGAAGGMVQSVIRNSPADRANIESGFIIRKINGRRVRDMATVLSVIQQADRIELEGIYADFPGDFKYIFTP
ncbi:MAG: trypsin-like peptidase domain-containing protein [Saprospiraceae bacterium]|nr:trypsin-like peptidase domain-containing protein [Saprospiraceae bacterium]